MTTFGIPGERLRSVGKGEREPFDATDPTAPLILETLPPWDMYVYGLERVGNDLYIQFGEDGFGIYDVTDPVNPA